LRRRLDAVEVIGRALVMAAEGVDYRRIAAELGLPESTVRNWLRRARALADEIGQHFVRWAFELDRALTAARSVGGGLAARSTRSGGARGRRR
jgi:predicted transcriptional regulator